MKEIIDWIKDNQKEIEIEGRKHLCIDYEEMSKAFPTDKYGTKIKNPVPTKCDLCSYFEKRDVESNPCKDCMKETFDGKGDFIYIKLVDLLKQK